MTINTLDAPQAVTGSSTDTTRPRVARSPDETRLMYGAILIGAAFLLLGVVFGADMVAALGSVTTVVGTIIGTFFGVQIGSHGKEAAEKAARTALGKLDPDTADAVIKQL